MLNNLFDYLNNSGRYFLSFWGPMKTDSKHQKDYIIDIFDRSTQTKGQYTTMKQLLLNLFPVRRLSELHGKPDIVRVVSELGIVLLSYPSLLMVEVRWESVGFFLPGSLMVTTIYLQSTCFAHSSSFPPIPNPHLNHSGGKIRVGNWRRTSGVYWPSKVRPSDLII